MMKTRVFLYTSHLVLDLQMKVEEYKTQIAQLNAAPKSPTKSAVPKTYKQIEQKGIPMSMVLVLMIMSFLIGSWLF